MMTKFSALFILAFPALMLAACTASAGIADPSSFEIYDASGNLFAASSYASAGPSWPNCIQFNDDFIDSRVMICGSFTVIDLP